MALLDSEIARIRAELGFAVTTVNAEPYVGFVALFTLVIQNNLSRGAITSSSTVVAPATTPTATTIALADPTGFSVGDRVFVDVDDLQESSTIRSLSGSNIGLVLMKSHPAGYPVTVDGGEGIVREILQRIRETKAELAQTFGEGALKKVDELEWYGTKERTLFGNIGDQLMFWRSELSQALSNGQGLNMWRNAQAAAQRVAVY